MLSKVVLSIIVRRLLHGLRSSTLMIWDNWILYMVSQTVDSLPNKQRCLSKSLLPICKFKAGSPSMEEAGVDAQVAWDAFDKYWRVVRAVDWYGAASNVFAMNHTAWQRTVSKCSTIGNRRFYSSTLKMSEVNALHKDKHDLELIGDKMIFVHGPDSFDHSRHK